MHAGFVLGNGISRKNIPCSELMKHGRVYGCNALYREFTPYVLVATDTPIAKRIQQSEYALTNRFYTRRPIMNLGALPVPHFTFSSGPNAVAIAAMDECHPIYLLGFDMAATQEGKFNNVYSGSEFYKPNDSDPTFVGNWVKQLFEVISTYPHKQFIRVVGETTSDLPTLNVLPNYTTIELNKFVLGLMNKRL